MALALMLGAAGCGSSSTAPAGTGGSPDARAISDQYVAATAALNEKSPNLAAAYKAQNLAILKEDVKVLRTRLSDYQARLGQIMFPSSMAADSAALLDRLGVVIAAYADLDSAATVADFDRGDATILQGPFLQFRRTGDAVRRDLGLPLRFVTGPAAPPASGAILFQDDFATPSGGWTVGDTPYGSFRYQDGQYRITATLRSPDGDEASAASAAKAGPQPADVSVQVDAKQVAPAQGQLGVICRGNSATKSGYTGLIATTGEWTMNRVDHGNNVPLATHGLGEVSAAVRPLNEVNHIRLDCRNRGPEGALVTLYVNDQKVAEGRDSSPLPAGQVLMTVSNLEGRCCTEVFYDNLIMRALS